MRDFTPIRTATIITIALLTLGLSAGCNFFNAAPSECIQAAEDAGLPDAVIEQLRNPDDLNALERAALQQALRRAGIDDVCEVASESSTRSDETDTNDDARPTLVRIGTADEQQQSSAAETTRDDGQAQPGKTEAQCGFALSFPSETRLDDGLGSRFSMRRCAR